MTAQAEALHAALAAAAALRVRNSAVRCLCGVLNGDDLTGIGALGLLGWRRKRKAQAVG